MESKGARLEGDPNEIPIITDSVMNFKIISSGQFAGASREITAIVMDLNRSAAKIKSLVDEEKKAQGGGSGGSGTGGSGGAATTGNNKSQAPAKGAPRVVYWNEK
ncbi:hypothetical protein D3C87_1780980 [compost metagenome]